MKLWQTFALITELERIVIPRDIPLIICGDFNSEPSSAVYDLITHGTVISGSAPGQRPELTHVPRDASDLRILPDLENITHRLEISSMMASVNNGIEPPFTNYTQKFKGIQYKLLYWHNSGSLILGLLQALWITCSTLLLDYECWRTRACLVNRRLRPVVEKGCHQLFTRLITFICVAILL